MPAGNRAWCFTLNNPTDDEKAILPKESTELPLWEHAVALCYQLEAGENGTPHYQGYVRFSCQRSLNVVKRFLPRAHWEPARGLPKHNLDYCTKNDGRLGEPVVLGQFGNNGGGSSHLKRTEVVSLIEQDPYVSTADLVAAGGLDVLISNPNLLGLARGYLLQDARRAGVTCELYFGRTGTGKSRLADTRYPDAYRKTTGPWWDGYQGQSTVILDDFDGDFMPVGQLLRVIDRYPLDVPVKGSFVKLVANHFVITSNLLPAGWYPLIVDTARYQAIIRRLSTVVDFNYDPPLLTDGRDYFSVTFSDRGRERVVLPWLDPPVTPTQLFNEPFDLDDSVSVTIE